MKNLELLELTHKPISNLSNVNVFAQTLDTIYFISNNSLQKYDFKKNATEELSPLFEDSIYLKHLQFENKICIVTTENIHIFNPSGLSEIQTVSFSHDIAAISWNPTEEIVAIVSQNGEVFTYTIDYENGEVFPQGKSSVGAKIPDTVYVGWGSKETQFRGSEGKYKNQQPVEENPIHDQKPTISWRGNGEMFVVNYWIDQKRKFVVFEHPCKALYRSEDCPGLQPPISWRPAGNMIATLTEINNQQNIVIFEKNGQKRFNFELNFGNVRVKNLKWSPCAQILTVHTENVADKSQNIHLLMASNYKWYEKQRLRFDINQLLDFDWLETTQFSFTLRVVTENDIINYIFATKIHNFDANCAVIDGQVLQLTDFEDAIIPPIMYSKKIINDRAINFCIFKNPKIIILIDAGNYLKLVDVDSCQIINSVKIDNDRQFPLSCHHFIFDSNSNSVFFASETESETVFYNINLQNFDKNFINVTTDNLRHLCIQNGATDTLKCIDSNLYMNDNQCHSVRQEITSINDKTYNCHLNSNCHFYVNDDKLSDCVNSFQIFDSYLLYTTKQNELFCLRLNEDTFKNQNYRRNIEQGATIVAAIPNSPKIVLQLPRGNLETISCRLISIDILDKTLAGGEWEKALRFIRLEKLNSNLLFDLDPQRFLGQIDKFINGAKTISELNSLCLEFEENNIFNTIYKNWGKQCCDYVGKIDGIFGEMFKFFDGVDYATYITTIMDLLRRSSDDSSMKQKLIEAVNTLKIYGCDQDKLYSEALLLYDLELAHFLASCCQLDPRIYEPHLNNLKNLPEVDRRYEINIFAKKPKSAIVYLLRSNKTKDDDVLEFLKNHDVSREAYESCSRNNRFYQTISRAFAQSLSRRGLHQEAGLILKRADLLEEALDEFKLSLQWREVLNLTIELKINDVERLKIVNDVAKRLCQNHVIKDAAILYEFYAGNYEMAVKVLLENYYFEECLHIAKKYNRGDIVVSEIIPTLYKHKCYLEEKLGDLGNLFDKYRTRLAQVRKNRIDKFHGDYEGDDKEDLFSDAGSTISKSSRSSRSRSSTASSRNRRKEEKKKQDLREGGIYEDIALIRALHCTIKEIYSKGDEVRVCCVLLMQESDISYGEVKKFHDFYWLIDTKIKNGVGEIWPPHFYSNNQTQDVQELADLENFENLDVEFRTPPTGQSNWKLNFF